MRARRDINTAVAFLSTRVKTQDEDEWGKLKRVIKYLNGAKNLKLMLSADNLSIIKWFVDALYAIHNDCKGHTGAMFTLGSGASASLSWKQKINGKSSTEAKLIAVDEAISQILWTGYFLESQGYHIPKNTLYQYNKSAIILEKN